MLGSDPIYNGSLSPSGEWEQFFGNFTDPQTIVWFPTGRLHQTSQYYRLDVTWASLLPPDDQLALFEDIFLERELIRQFRPASSVDEWITSTKPALAYSRAHWISRMLGGLIPTNPLQSGLWNTSWYLYYGTYDDLAGVQYLDICNQFLLDTSLFDVDSSGTPPSGDIDSPPEISGWAIVLVHKSFAIPDNSPPDTPPTVSYHAYGAWTLDQDPAYDPYTVFDPLVPTKWNMFANLLNFPPNYLTLRPFQP